MIYIIGAAITLAFIATIVGMVAFAICLRGIAEDFGK